MDGAPPGPESIGTLRLVCVVLSRADAMVLVETLGGDITKGANVFAQGSSRRPARGFHIYGLMPDGISGAHGD